jgi:glycosyltransferase involved in cell wall biosynthesis
VPSSRFRVRQYIPHLRQDGWTVQEYPSRPDKFAGPAGASVLPLRVRYGQLTARKLASRVPAVVAAQRADVVWLERDLLPGRRTLERLLPSPLVFDVDDALWLKSEAARAAVAATAAQADLVLAGNDYLAHELRKWARRVEVVPTAVDTDRWVPPLALRRDDPLLIGWTGSRSTLPYLEALDEPLGRALRLLDARLLVVADHPPSLPSVEPSSVQFERWTPDAEVVAVQRMTIGLAPLQDDAWARGKCGLKMLQYLACGVPVVSADVGANGIIGRSAGGALLLDPDARWDDALTCMARDLPQWQARARSARESVVTGYSVAAVGAALGDHFADVLAAPGAPRGWRRSLRGGRSRRR